MSYAKQHKKGKIRKVKLMQFLGGKCNRCGYNKNYAALQFHHINPKEKEFNIDIRKCSNYNWDRLLDEAKKCELLCANCHFEHHNPNYCGDEISEVYKSMPINLDTVNICQCGKIIDDKASKCESCYHLTTRKVIRPSKEELTKMVWEKPTRVLAEEFGVSDVAIAKWCKMYGISKPPRGYWAKLNANC